LVLKKLASFLQRASVNGALKCNLQIKIKSISVLVSQERKEKKRRKRLKLSTPLAK
jgi:hypothetical protein